MPCCCSCPSALEEGHGEKDHDAETKPRGYTVQEVICSGSGGAQCVRTKRLLKVRGMMLLAHRPMGQVVGRMRAGSFE